MNILIVPDSFKGTLAASMVCDIIRREFLVRNSGMRCVLLPMSDGGEGFIDTMLRVKVGKYVPELSLDPLNRPVSGGYGVLEEEGEVVIETAVASGLHLLSHSERNPLYTSSYGTGMLIRKAVEAGYKKFVVGLGGSATNDAGAGMLQALGARLLDRYGKDIKAGGFYLSELHTMDMGCFNAVVQGLEFKIACDVRNPLVGKNGASWVYGPQKGATEEICRLLDRNLSYFASFVKNITEIDIAHTRGGGAAGGLGAAFKVFFPAKTRAGLELMSDYTGLEQKIQAADLVITGEGKFDFQSLQGKLASGVLKLAKKYGKRSLLIAGVVDRKALKKLNIQTDYVSLIDYAGSPEEAMTNPAYWLSRVMGEWIEKKL